MTKVTERIKSIKPKEKRLEVTLEFLYNAFKRTSEHDRIKAQRIWSLIMSIHNKRGDNAVKRLEFEKGLSA